MFLSTRFSTHFETGWWEMPEDEREQKYPFLLVFLEFCGLRATSKCMSLADVLSAIYIKNDLYNGRQVILSAL